MKLYLDLQNGNPHPNASGNSDQLSLAFLDKKERWRRVWIQKPQAVTDKAYIGEGTALALKARFKTGGDRFSTTPSEEIRANGTYDKIAAKYFTFDIYGADL